MSCKKEEVPSKISGYILEAGTDRPVRKADVYLIIEEGGWNSLKPIQHTIADENGHFEINIDYHGKAESLFITGISPDYYEIFDAVELQPYRLSKGKTEYIVYLYRRCDFPIHITRPDGPILNSSLEIYTPRESIHWDIVSKTDTTIFAKGNLFTENNIDVFKHRFGQTSYYNIKHKITNSIYDTLHITF